VCVCVCVSLSLSLSLFLVYFPKEGQKQAGVVKEGKKTPPRKNLRPCGSSGWSGPRAWRVRG